MLIFSSPKHDSAHNNSISVFIDFDHPDVLVADNNSDMWATLNTTISSLQRPTQFLLGFHDRARMIRFAADVVSKKLPLLSTHGEVLYTVAKMEERKKDLYRHLYWYQASLESEELQGQSVIPFSFQIRTNRCATGEGILDPLKVYPGENKPRSS